MRKRYCTDKNEVWSGESITWNVMSEKEIHGGSVLHMGGAPGARGAVGSGQGRLVGALLHMVLTIP